MRSILAQLDDIAAELETMGQTPLAYGVDQISDKLEKEAFLKELGQGVKDRIIKMMPKEKALEVLAKVPGLEEKLPDMIARVLEKLKAEGAISTEVGISKEAGLGDFLGKPILLALAVDVSDLSLRSTPFEMTEKEFSGKLLGKGVSGFLLL